MRLAGRAATTLIAAALVACESGGVSPAPPAPDASPPAPQGGSVVMGVFGEPATLDPRSALASDLTFALARPLYRSLYRFTPDGGAVPDLARSVEPVPGGVRVEVAEGTWSDGRPITARDVLTSIRRAHPRSGLAGVSAVARGRSAVVLTGDVPDWEDALARLSFVLPADGRKAYSGPYRLTSRTEGLQIVMKPNPSSEVLPVLDRLTIQFTEGIDMLLGLLDRRRIDVAWIPSGLNLDQRLEELDLEHADALGWEHVLIDMTTSDLDQGLRKAIATGLDRGAIEKGFVRADGRTADTLGPGPGRAGASGPFEAVFRGGGGGGGGASVTLGAPSGDELLELTQRMVQVQLDLAGFDVDLINVDARRFYGEWQRANPLDLALRRRGGAPGVAVDAQRGLLQQLPLFHVETVMAWLPGVGGIDVNGTLDGPLWDAHEWFLDEPEG